MSLTRAERIARRAAWQIPREVKDVALHVHAVAVQTGDRAYQYERQSDGSLLEIRVWPSGDVKLTPVDDQGNSLVPTPKPTLNF